MTYISNLAPRNARGITNDKSKTSLFSNFRAAAPSGHDATFALERRRPAAPPNNHILLIRLVAGINTIPDWLDLSVLKMID